ncbi:HNH endonuclease [Asticcacaulis sp.]|uniref:HNH endonuclease n=1 Tax=Asticcacaulis sp. TaxID=1872648 RepID=UPI002BEC2CEE|nr:HNH endonuclease [Asticcacaulis sp.]HTM81959.1 HNH endonuclease [Asticcacaulis sp.]
MSDPLKPPLNSLTFSIEECAAITAALASKKPWDHTKQGCKIVEGHLISVKGKLKAFHLQRQKNDCAYCKNSLAGRDGVSIDREHILPKSKFKEKAYDVFNISIACKRCNMDIKRERWNFLINPSIGPHLEDTGNYLIIHPNFDNWYKHLWIEAVRSGESRIVKYLVNPNSKKGSYTYTFFKLRDLEEDSFDDAQGLNRPHLRRIEDVFEEYKPL